MASRKLGASLSIGTDICHIPRIYKIITQREGKDFMPFVRKLFSSQELGKLGVENKLIDMTVRRRAQFIAGRFAVKEAAKKANWWRSVYWHHVDVHTRKGGSIFLLVKNNGDNQMVESTKSRGVEMPPEGDPEVLGLLGRPPPPEFLKQSCSISHDGDYATATVIATMEEEDEERFGMRAEVDVKSESLESQARDEEEKAWNELQQAMRG